jgi:signal transduction histidine kinase
MTHKSLVHKNDEIFSYQKKTKPTEKIKQITEPFVSAKAGGSGLGLVIVKSLNSAHHGELIIHSKQKEGTTITIVIPLLNP